MVNPFAKFELRFIPALRKIQKRYLVSQTFRRDKHLFRDPAKRYLLLTHYNDPGLAKIHLKAVQDDPLAAMIDLEKDRHRQKLESMLEGNGRYMIYSSLVKDRKSIRQVLDRSLKIKIQEYLGRHTDWRISREQTIRPVLEITFGELFVSIKYGSRTLRVKLDEIEGN